MKKFCEYQVKCKEDVGMTWTCTAHLNEAWAFTCPYKSFKDSKRAVGRCEDGRRVECPEGCLETLNEKKL